MGWESMTTMGNSIEKELSMFEEGRSDQRCYESPKKEITSCTFEQLIHNLKTYYHKRSLTVCDWVEDIFKRGL